jgi:hypothetical protein
MNCRVYEVACRPMNKAASWRSLMLPVVCGKLPPSRIAC